MLVNNLFEQLRNTEVLITQESIKGDQRVILGKCKLIEAQKCIETMIKADTYMLNINNCKSSLSPMTDSSWFDVRVVNPEYSIDEKHISYHPILFSVCEDETTKPEKLFYDIIDAFNNSVADR